MTDTTFVDKTGNIETPWLQDVNNDVYSRANKAALAAETPVAGQKRFVLGTDGGWFIGKTGAAPGTYADNGGAYCGTITIPTGGDGSTAWVRIDGADIHYQYGTTGAITIDIANGNYFYPSGTTTGVITFTFSTPAYPDRVASFTLEMLGAGTNAPVWPSSVQWPGGTEPVWTAGIDVVGFISRDNGTTWLGLLGGLNFS
jgi:hypothetical protein